MEPSKILGGSEECHSNESGWTMYIGSLVQGTDQSEGDDHSEAANAYAADNGGRTRADEITANYEADSDDSLASDASSGPIHRVHGTSHFQTEKDEEEDDCCLDKKAKKSVKRMIKKERKKEKEQMTFMAKGASTPARSVSKVRKSVWLGK